ncbi:winged helix-turn-helix domain-containing protein [Microbispora sp. NEAU-D428]|uniref:winged helix-turn-helix domain-containing protein n=1 Tax=Microbispora sitophila TaxID=2771537 RepID=UPI0018691E5E|nr:winged helix-turn-helix domain-containing protein [Microbispora sitophila]MBE3010297.1 winged helix-turn-helix domain-containing protein [Microbispora sitophila]
MRVLIVEDESYLAEAIRDGLPLKAIAADIAGDGHTALELLNVNAYDIAAPFTNAVRITVSALRKRLGEPWLIATVPGAGYRIGVGPGAGRAGGDGG